MRLEQKSQLGDEESESSHGNNSNEDIYRDKANECECNAFLEILAKNIEGDNNEITAHESHGLFSHEDVFRCKLTYEMD